MSTTPPAGPSLPMIPVRSTQAPTPAQATQAAQQTPAVTAPAEPAPAESVAQEALNLQTPAQSGTATQAVGFVEAASDPVSPAELRWAKNLEQRVENGYQPTPEEIELYQEIYQKVQTAPPAPTPDTTQTGVSQQELQWALDLEEKVKMGYQPTPEEVKAYQDIAIRVAHGPIEGKTPELPPEVSQEEIDWALQLEKKVIQGYTPNQDEVKKYTDIAERLSQGYAVEQPAPTPPVGEPAPVSEAEFQWAQELMKHVQAGYQPTREETLRYNEIYSRSQANQHQQVNQAELDWADQLQQKITLGYKPSPAEVKQYEKIYQRYQEQNQATQSLHQRPPGVPATEPESSAQDSSAVQETAPAAPQQPVLPKNAVSAVNFGVGRWSRQA